MIMVRRVAMKKERNGHIVVALEVVVDMEVGVEAVGTEEDMAGTEVENTEMEITEAVDMEMEDTEVDMAVDIAETIVVVVVVVTVCKITSLDGLHFHINVDYFDKCWNVTSSSQNETYPVIYADLSLEGD
jgi:hypothetical protein